MHITQSTHYDVSDDHMGHSSAPTIRLMAGTRNTTIMEHFVVVAPQMDIVGAYGGLVPDVKLNYILIIRS